MTENRNSENNKQQKQQKSITTFDKSGAKLQKPLKQGRKHAAGEPTSVCKRVIENYLNQLACMSRMPNAVSRIFAFRNQSTSLRKYLSNASRRRFKEVWVNDVRGKQVSISLEKFRFVKLISFLRCDSCN